MARECARICEIPLWLQEETARIGATGGENGEKIESAYREREEEEEEASNRRRRRRRRSTRCFRRRLRPQSALPSAHGASQKY